MKIELRHIRHFIAVAEDLHFRRAAERLNISQPALSRSIQHFENCIDMRLLERNNRNVNLTKAGEVLLAGCQSAVATIEGALMQARKTGLGQAGHLAIGYTDFAISGCLPLILQSFREKHPAITVEPLFGMTDMQLAHIHAGKLDLGFVTGPVEQPDIHSAVVQRDRFVAVLYEDHPLARKDKIYLSELAHEPFIMGSLKDWRHFHEHTLKICRDAGFVPNMVQQAFNSEGIFGLVACGMGVTIHIECANNYLRKGLVVKPLRGLDATLQTVAVWKEDAHAPARQVFAEFLVEHLKEHQPAPA